MDTPTTVPHSDGGQMPGADQAVVIGASMTGLLAARVLADHFDQVIVVERDRLPSGPAPRPGLPQARHVHILLLRGQQILEQRFPGIQTELAAAGAPWLSLTQDFAVFQQGHWAPRFASPYYLRTCSRDLLEAVVRNRLRQHPKVRFLEQHAVVALLASEDRTRVVGVRVAARPNAEADRSAEPIRAALVVDASGRESRTPEWLAALGYPRPFETTINALLAYASRWYRPADKTPAVPRGILVNGRPPLEPRGGVLFPVEGPRWVVTLGGIGGVSPPTDEAGFLAFAQALPQPTLYERLQAATPLTPIAGYRRTENRLRHYERLGRLPDGLVLVGDAVCAFNPVYGQGMTVAALGTELLDQMLREQHQHGGDRAGLTHRFQQRLAQVNTTPWLLATGADLSWPTTVGGHPRPVDRLAQRYVDRVLRLMAEDRHAYQVFLEVTHLLRAPAALFQPRILLGVVRQAVARHVRRQVETHRGGDRR